MLNTKQEQSLLNPSYITLFFVNMIASASFSMVSTIMTMFLCDTGYSTAMAGTVVGVLSIAAMVIRPLSGYICDRINRKRLLMLAMSGIMVSMIGYGLTQQLVMLYALRILHGVCFSLVTTVTMAMVADCVPASKRSQGLGLFSIGQTITLALAPSLGLWLAANVSFSATFFGAAVFAGCAVLLTGVAYRSQSQPQLVKGKSTLQNFLVREAALFAIVAAAVSATTSVENSFVAVYGRSLSAGNVGWYFTLSAVSLFVSRLVFGRIADKRGMKYVLYPGLAVMTAAFLLMSLATEQTVVPIFAACAILKALGLGAVQPTLQAASVASVSADRRGAASGTYYLGTDVGQGLAPMVGGMLVDSMGYGPTFALFAVPLAATGLLCGLKQRREHD